MKEFNCNAYVVDMIMGSGKSSSAINYMNANPDKKFMYITPYLDEINRIKENCSNLNFVEPMAKPTKLADLKRKVDTGRNIVSTHALFRNYDLELIEACRVKGYTLILDEVADVIEKFDITADDFKNLKENYIDIDEETGLVCWRENQVDYDGVFDNIKHLCELNSLAYYGGSLMMWLFPIEVFNAFDDIYILTYMFDAQVQKYYYDYFGLKYEKLYIKGNSLDTYAFTNNPDEANIISNNYHELIDIVDNKKLNKIGDGEYDLSVSWYKRHKDSTVMKQVKANMINFFKHISKTKSNKNLWTTFSDYKRKLSGDGYTKGFIPINMRSSNEYKEKTAVAYPVNRYMNTGVKNFFIQHGVKVDEDGFATSEMLQFIWRSAIREGNPITIYVPSKRMRTLLQKWIDENSTV